MNKVSVMLSTFDDSSKWNVYVGSHSFATLYHLYEWRNVIRKTYGHQTYYLMAVRDNHSIAGVMPLVHLRHFIFGNNLISIPFFDMGGILADDKEAEEALLIQAVNLGKKLGAKTLELRHTKPLSFLTTKDLLGDLQGFNLEGFGNLQGLTRSHKVRMLLDLPGSSDILMKSFKAKLRSQIKKPIKEGLQVKIGGLELLEDFYHVFLINMRDLGSPVHSKELIRNVLRAFPDRSRIFIVHKEDKPLACSLVIGFGSILENPWASALREYSRLSPNMLLYWSMLEYGSDNGYTMFDFGRSTPGEGTYRFKEQWGAKPMGLHWHYISLNNRPMSAEPSEKSKFDKAIEYWKRLPVSVTQILGPMIRKHIGL